MRYTLAFLSILLPFGCSKNSGTVALEKAEPTTETVTYASGEDKVSGFLCHPPGKGPFPGLMLIHDDFGLTDWVKEQAKRLAEQGYMVLAVDLYRGEAVSNLLDAHIMDRGLPEDRVQRDLKAAVDYLVSRKDVRASRLGVAGWDMGGGYALDAAIRDPRLLAVVTCYGRLTTDAKLLAPLKASVFCVFAGKDKGISPETIEQFRAAMTKAEKRIAGMRVYSECAHGFLDPATWPTNGAPPNEDVKDAWERIDDYLDKALQQ
ncbi:MAG TPA: dienelactone hydrolase family protein [Gemmataceae bacterium]|nr:dienelactone hydrolase family protein [Gemmataceae bacterium]